MKDGSLSVKKSVFEDNTALKVSSNANAFPSLGENKLTKAFMYCRAEEPFSSIV